MDPKRMNRKKWEKVQQLGYVIDDFTAQIYVYKEKNAVGNHYEAGTDFYKNIWGSGETIYEARVRCIEGIKYNKALLENKKLLTEEEELELVNVNFLKYFKARNISDEVLGKLQIVPAIFLGCKYIWNVEYFDETIPVQPIVIDGSTQWVLMAQIHLDIFTGETMIIETENIKW